jgi:hypothetical protein
MTELPSRFLLPSLLQDWFQQLALLSFMRIVIKFIPSLWFFPRILRQSLHLLLLNVWVGSISFLDEVWLGVLASLFGLILGGCLFTRWLGALSILSSASTVMAFIHAILEVS